MRLSSSIVATLFILSVGIAFGALIFRNTPATSAAAAVRFEARSVPVSTPADEPVQSKEGPPAVPPHADAIHCIAVVFARQSADIVASSDGRLEAVYVNLGDRLDPGDLIAKTESRSIGQQLQIAEALLRSIQAEHRAVEVDVKDSQVRYGRREQLWEAGLISNEEVATAKVQVERAEANLQIAQARIVEQMARIEDAKASLADTVVTAGFAGTVAARYLDSGATVRSGTPIISLMRSDDLWVRFAIPETLQARLGIGSAIDFQVEGSTVAVPGVIEHVSPVMAAMSQEFLAEAKLKLPGALPEHIKPGASGLVSSRNGARSVR